MKFLFSCGEIWKLTVFLDFVRISYFFASVRIFLKCFDKTFARKVLQIAFLVKIKLKQLFWYPKNQKKKDKRTKKTTNAINPKFKCCFKVDVG